MVRLLKMILVVCVALQGLFYAVQNIVNLDAAFAAVQAVLSMSDHTWYTNHFGPPVTSEAAVWIALWVIIAGEMLVGVLGIMGAFDMAMAGSAPADRFNASKKLGVFACGLGVVVWLGFFMAFGGAYFQMWQTEMGAGSLEGAFMYAMTSGMVMIFVNQRDE